MQALENEAQKNMLREELKKEGRNLNGKTVEEQIHSNLKNQKEIQESQKKVSFKQAMNKVLKEDENE